MGYGRMVRWSAWRRSLAGMTTRLIRERAACTWQLRREIRARQRELAVQSEFVASARAMLDAAERCRAVGMLDDFWHE